MEINMTKRGEMLIEDGRKQGIQEGIKKNSLDTAIKEGLSDELIAKLTGLTESQVSIIRQSIGNQINLKGYRKGILFQ